MIDIHTHILPGLDDGAKDIEVSIDLLRGAKKQGIDTVFVTPHFITGLYEPTVKEIKQKLKMLKDRLNSESLDMKLFSGAEINIASEIDENELGAYSLNGTRKYILLELPFVTFPLNCDERIYGFISKGFTPILAHPERAFFIMKNRNKLRDWKKRGVLIQINSKSVLGRYGKTVSNVAVKILNDGLVDFVASDTHNRKWGFDFNKVKPVLRKIVGKAKTDELLGQNARRLLLSE